MSARPIWTTSKSCPRSLRISPPPPRSPPFGKLIYTTNAIESLNSSLRRATRHRHPFPTLDSLYKLFYLALKRISAKWTQTTPGWHDALNRFTIEFGDRMPRNP